MRPTRTRIPSAKAAAAAAEAAELPSPHARAKRLVSDGESNEWVSTEAIHASSAQRTADPATHRKSESNVDAIYKAKDLIMSTSSMLDVAINDKGTAVPNALVDIHLTSTRELSELLFNLDDDGATGPGVCSRPSLGVTRIASFAALEKLDMGADGGSADSGSEDADGSFSNDTAALPLGAAGCPASARKDGNRKEWAGWEDEAIRSGVMKLGTRWRAIAAELPGRSDDAVRNRWARLQQSTCGSKPTPPPRMKREGVEQRQSWTDEEDTIISSSVLEFGHRWNRIAERLPRRTEHAIRNRWHRLQMRAIEVSGKGTVQLSELPLEGQLNHIVEHCESESCTAALPGRVTAPLKTLAGRSGTVTKLDDIQGQASLDREQELRARLCAAMGVGIELAPADSEDGGDGESEGEAADAAAFFNDELPTGFDFASMLAP